MADTTPTLDSPFSRLCVFCGSSPGADPAYVEAARALGRRMAADGIELVYGGGSVGLMGAIADAVTEAGGHVIGVIPEGLFGNAVEHDGIADLRFVGSMHERKALMYELSDGFIALPGGLGTLEELAEALTWVQIGLHRKPLALYDINGFYRPLVRWFETAVDAHFLKPANLTALSVADNLDDLLDGLAAPVPDQPKKWIEEHVLGESGHSRD